MLRYTALLFVFLTAVVHGVHAEDQPATYRVVGIASDDALNVRRGPGEKYNPPVARLKNGTSGIRITGPPFMNGNDDWVPILVSDIEGWVRPQYLERVWPVATLPDDSPSPDSAGTESEPATTTPKAKTADLSNLFKTNDRERSERPTASRRNDGTGCLVLAVIAVFVIAAAAKTKEKPLRANQCPKCGHNTLKTRQRLFGSSYRRCSRFWCGYNEAKLEKAEREAESQRKHAAQRQARWEARDHERQQRIEQERSDILIEQQRQKQRNERDAAERERRGY
jgi:hypothetical protein